MKWEGGSGFSGFSQIQMSEIRQWFDDIGWKIGEIYAAPFGIYNCYIIEKLAMYQTDICILLYEGLEEVLRNIFWTASLKQWPCEYLIMKYRIHDKILDNEV